MELGETITFPVLEALSRLGHGDDHAEALAATLQSALESMGVTTGAPKAGRASSVKRSVDSEMDLAWRLLQAQEITEDEYSAFAQDLTENSTKNIEVPVTLLHVLNDRAYTNYERVMVFLAHESGVPIVSLGDF